MKLAIMQPYLFPYIGYFQLINAVDKFVIFDDVNFIKKGWINRNYILVNGESHLFTVPLQDVSQNDLIMNVKIILDDKWRSKLLRSIEMSYKKAPFFSEVIGLVESIIQLKEQSISKMIVYSFFLLKEKLQLNAQIIKSSTIYNNHELKGQYRILSICKQENATQYINPIGGTQLYENKLFGDNNIELQFLRTAPVSYKQNTKSFIPNLSIIDVLMFNGFEGTRNLLLQYVLE